MVLAHLVGRWVPGHLAVMVDVSFCVLRRLWSMWFLLRGCWRQLVGFFGCRRQLVGFEFHLRVVEVQEGVLGTSSVWSAAWKFPVILEFALVGRCSRTLTFGTRLCGRHGRPFLARCGEIFSVVTVTLFFFR